MLNDYENSHGDLLKKSGNLSMNLSKTRSLCIEIYRAINNLNPEFTKSFFKVCKTNRAQREQYTLNLEIPESNQVFFWYEKSAHRRSQDLKRLTFPYSIKRKYSGF